MLSSPSSVGQLPSPIEIVKDFENINDNNNAVLPQKELIDTLKQMLPSEVRPLSRDEEKHIESVIKNITDIPAKASLEGEHLNTSYGYIGAEQHLKRYPGDILENHGPYYKEGIAPGLGAWGYFASQSLI